MKAIAEPVGATTESCASSRAQRRSTQKTPKQGPENNSGLIKTDEVSVQEADARFGVSRSTLYRNGLA
jgi:hypothetical protein